MSILIKGMEMPKDCPMCPMAHWNGYGEFTGCEIVAGKKYADKTDPEYMKSTSRPDWCPLVPVPPHGRLIDADDFIKAECNHCDGACEAMPCNCLTCKSSCRCDLMLDLIDAPTIIPAEEAPP